MFVLAKTAARWRTEKEQEDQTHFSEGTSCFLFPIPVLLLMCVHNNKSVKSFCFIANSIRTSKLVKLGNDSRSTLHHVSIAFLYDFLNFQFSELIS